MTKETGVPKLKGAANLAIWLFRLKKYITVKGTWDAVRFVPYNQSTRQKFPSNPRQSNNGTSVAPNSLSQELVRETIETETPSPRQTKTDPEKKPKFGSITNYEDFNFSLDSTKDQNN